MSSGQPRFDSLGPDLIVFAHFARLEQAVAAGADVVLRSLSFIFHDEPKRHPHWHGLEPELARGIGLHAENRGLGSHFQVELQRPARDWLSVVIPQSPAVGGGWCHRQLEGSFVTTTYVGKPTAAALGIQEKQQYVVCIDGEIERAIRLNLRLNRQRWKSQPNRPGASHQRR